MVWSLVIEVVLIFFIGLGLHSLNTTQQSQPNDAKVYILYTIGGYIPLPGLYESFTPAPWIEENFAQATQTGKFIFIASHGGMTSGSFTLSVPPTFNIRQMM